MAMIPYRMFHFQCAASWHVQALAIDGAAAGDKSRVLCGATVMVPMVIVVPL
jgi:hypothetical protein